MYRQSLLIALLSLCAIPTAVSELQAATDTERTQCKFPDHTDVTIEYGKLRMGGRKIFGGLVAYGKVWEMGDRRSPTFVANANLLVGGKEVPAGQYRLFTIPNSDNWTMVVKKAPSKDNQNQTDEVARINLLFRHLSSPIENFTISFDQLKGGCVLNLRWEETEASVLLAEKK